MMLILKLPFHLWPNHSTANLVKNVSVSDSLNQLPIERALVTLTQLYCQVYGPAHTLAIEG